MTSGSNEHLLQVQSLVKELLFFKFESIFAVRMSNYMLATLDRFIETDKDMRLKPGFHMVVSVVSVVSFVRKKFIGQIEFILSRTKSCICRFFCIEHLYGRFP